MPKQYSVERDRRAVLRAGGALILGAALWPTRSLAQGAGGNKSRIGVIGSGKIGGTIGGLVGEGRAFGAVLVAPSRRVERHGHGPWARWRKPARSSRRSHSAT